MGKTKKSGAGPVAVWRLSGGVKGVVNSVLSVRTARFCSLKTNHSKDSEIGLSGLENGFWNVRLSSY